MKNQQGPHVHEGGNTVPASIKNNIENRESDLEVKTFEVYRWKRRRLATGLYHRKKLSFIRVAGLEEAERFMKMGEKFLPRNMLKDKSIEDVH